ncbi:MAG: Obg family GTPase CgtA, partial [Clostridia bacterium]|nr:Obg family GTPase CgtA [Clostridia bacterium]
VGEKTVARKIALELKIIADVGLIGFPNVGKSTVLSKISGAKPKIANYHFTTMSPNLGVVRHFDDSFVCADIPGLIEGAAEGAGLGTEFLRHIERTRLLVHIVDVSGVEGRDPYSDYLKINEELAKYSEELAKRPQVVVLNKCDIYGAEDNAAEFEKKIGGKRKTFRVSAINGAGVEEVIKYVFDELKKLPERKPLEFEKFTYEKADEREFTVSFDEEDGAYIVDGPFVSMLERNVVLNDQDSLAYMQKTLKDFGVINALRRAGAKDGDTVIIGDVEFEFTD